MTPQFPEFKEIEITDRPLFLEFFKQYQPRTSELNFSNLFMWREYYQFKWTLLDQWLVILTLCSKEGPAFFPPIGPPSRTDIAVKLLNWLKHEKSAPDARIRRADTRLKEELESTDLFTIDPVRDHFDYVYTSEALAGLAGRKLHSKRNHINKFNRLYEFEYRPIDKALVVDCLRFFKKWCDWHQCDENNDLRFECRSIHQTLLNWDDLDLEGGAIFIDNQVAAFTVGEQMNDRTAVVHIEKADPDIPQLYAVINQQFSQQTWRHLEYINREQDLGKPGLRQAKSSYYPHHLVEKYVIRMK